MNKPVLAGIVFLLAFVGILIYATMKTARNRHRVEVCMDFAGRRECRVASAAERDQAFKMAVQNVCGVLAKGLDDSSRCQRTDPASVTWLSSPGAP